MGVFLKVYSGGYLLQLSEANALLTSDLSSFCQMLGTQTKSVNVASGAQQQEKTQETPSTNDKESEKEQSDLPQASFK